MKKEKLRNLIYFIITGIVIGLYYFIALPPINFQSAHFILYLSFVIGYILAIVLFIIRNRLVKSFVKKGKTKYRGLKLKISGQNIKIERKERTIEEGTSLGSITTKSIAGVFSLALLFTLVLGVAGTKLFSAKAYSRQLNIVTQEEDKFDEDFTFEDGELLLPLIDKDIAFKAAQARLSTYGAQYNIDIDNFTLLNVNRNGKNELVRVTPLEYSGFFVSLNRYSKGTIGYIEVNVVTKETRLVEVEGGMKYMPSSILFKDLDFHIRMNYPSMMYKDKFFEIDDEDNPYWIVPTYKNEIALFNGNMPKGVIIINPVDGESNYYNLGEEPSWVDRVVLDTIVQEQATNALKYSNGFINATFGQKKDVFQVSDGYNYFIKDGHTYYVSCVTSPNENDQTSIGFITIDLKTKEAKMYNIPGITEMRAREIAMLHEEVKAQQLEATWPILIDYENVPTYFLALKNEVQVRKIVLLNVYDGSIVAIGSSLDEARKLYEEKLTNQGEIKEEEKIASGVVKELVTYNQIRYFKLDDESSKTIFKLDLNNIEVHDAIFLKENDRVSLKYIEKENYNEVIEIEII